MTNGDRVELKLSNCFRFVAVIWQHSKQYQLFALKSDYSVAEEIDKGMCQSFAWCSNITQFAVVEPGVCQRAPVPTGGRLSNRKASHEGPVLRTPPSLIMKRVFAAEDYNAREGEEISGEWIVKSVTVQLLAGEEAYRVIGGPLLALCCRSSASGRRGAISASRKLPTAGQIGMAAGARTVKRLDGYCRLISWSVDSFSEDVSVTRISPVGGKFREPEEIWWDSSGRFALFSFSTSALLYSANPSFKLLYSLRACVCSALWFHQVLFLRLINGVMQSLFIYGDAMVVECMTLAHPGRGFSCAGIQGGIWAEKLPTGACFMSFLSVSRIHRQLLMVESVDKVVAMPLEHPEFQFRMLASAGRVDKAMNCAARIAPRCLDEVALVLVACGQIERALELRVSNGLRLKLVLLSRPIQPALDLCGDLDLLEKCLADVGIKSISAALVRLLEVKLASARCSESRDALGILAMFCEERRKGDSSVLATGLCGDRLSMYEMLCRQGRQALAAMTCLSGRIDGYGRSEASNALLEWNSNLKQNGICVLAVQK